MFIICLGGSSSSKVATPAVAPPAPEATPEEVITPEDTTVKANERKQAKAKGTGLTNYISPDVNVGDSGSGVNVPQ